MLFYFVVRAEEASLFQSDAPGSVDITTAMQSAIGSADPAQWVGPAPRITRTLQASFSAHALTDAAWLLAVDATDAPTAAATAQAITQRVTAALARIPSTSWGGGAAVLPWNESVNGPVSWWQNGQAAQTTSTDIFPSEFSPNENAVGPTTPLTAPQGGLQQLGTNVGQAGSNALQPFSGPNSPVTNTTRLIEVLLFGVAGVVVLYLAWPLLSGARRGTKALTSPRRSSRTTQQAYPNPHHENRHTNRALVGFRAGFMEGVKDRLQGSPWKRAWGRSGPFLAGYEAGLKHANASKLREAFQEWAAAS